MLGNNQQQEFPSNAEALAHVVKELDEIKRYAAGTWSNVDTEITEINNALRKLSADLQRVMAEVKDNDRQLDRMERYERTLNNIENSVRNLERRIK